MIEWVFLDVGNVLFNDDPQNFQSYRLVHDRLLERDPGYSFQAMLAEREELARSGAQFILRHIARRLLPPDELPGLFDDVRKYLIASYDEHNRLHEGVGDLLETLRRRWRLGIVANQPHECRESLKWRHLLEFFDVVAISDELDLHKPDERIFRWALGEARSAPGEAVMVGDRRDNDIAPAAALGMRTILVAWPDLLGRGWSPDDPRALAYVESCRRVPLFSAVPVGALPERTVSSLAEIPDAAASLAADAETPTM
jgi:HAD superfamily hydrolase (TIGR01509 family)